MAKMDVIFIWALTEYNLAQAFGIKVNIDQEKKEIWGVEKLSSFSS